jgi:hypothetical protein
VLKAVLSFLSLLASVPRLFLAWWQRWHDADERQIGGIEHQNADLIAANRALRAQLQVRERAPQTDEEWAEQARKGRL